MPEILGGLMDSLSVLIAHGRAAAEREGALAGAVAEAVRWYQAIEALERAYREGANRG